MIERERIKPIGQGAEARRFTGNSTTPFRPSPDSVKGPASLAPYARRQSFPTYCRNAIYQPLPAYRG